MSPKGILQQILGWTDQEIDDWLKGWSLPGWSNVRIRLPSIFVGRPQFRLGSLFILTAVVAMACWMIRSPVPGDVWRFCYRLWLASGIALMALWVLTRLRG
jgi:hypothetical protein